ETAEVAAIIKRLRPEICIVLGGPEVSHEVESQEIVKLADYVITGEADLAFAELCGQILAGSPPGSRIIAAELPQFSQLLLPYSLYTDDDVAHRIIYIEASRGCPFTCEFCLSSLDVPVRQAPLPQLLEEMARLIDRGVRHFKFVDRTFNLNIATSKAILEFFLSKYRTGHFFHFELIPDRLPAALREVIARFPPGVLQFEVGIQTFNEEVGARIKRRQNYERLADKLAFLREQTGVHIHADLIAGLPGESIESFGEGFDRLARMGPQEIQVGILKRLRGTPIVRHDAEWQMVYSPLPPYEILQNKLISFTEMQRLRRFAKYWELMGNSGNFRESREFIWGGNEKSPFRAFLRFSDWLHKRTGRTDSIALTRLFELLHEFLTTELRLASSVVGPALSRDYHRGGRSDTPGFLKNFTVPSTMRGRSPAPLLPKRQARHASA
ncbi:MAG TPA: radical SAM protein, partial [Verrucomicrobiae bacterium]|nr:radical SAM protein [Verrucomicrobiae bacterium]